MTELLVCLGVSALLTGWFASEKSPLAIMDHPNERSLHERVTPRSGGIAILLSVAVGWTWLFLDRGMPANIIWIAGAASVVAVISLIDDLLALSARVRILFHSIAALMLLAGGFVLPLGWTGYFLSFLGIVWMLNLYNFMDGMDGFAGGMALTGFGFLGLAGWLGGNPVYAEFCWVVAASSLGFLLFNFPPARIFMGDAGSATLGLLSAGTALWGISSNLFPVWFPLLVFSPFIVDATVTLGRRALRGEKVWEAHREHYYQRLVQRGWGHRKTVLVEYGLMVLCGTSALSGFHDSYAEFAIFSFWSIFYIGLMLFAEWHIMKGEPQ